MSRKARARPRAWARAHPPLTRQPVGRWGTCTAPNTARPDAEAARHENWYCACAAPQRRGAAGTQRPPWRPGGSPCGLRSWPASSAPKPSSREIQGLTAEESRLEAGRWLGCSGLAGQDPPAPGSREWGHCRGSLRQEEARSQEALLMLAAVWRPGAETPGAQTRANRAPGRLPQAWRSPTEAGSGQLPGGVLSCPWSALPPQNDP